MKTSQRQCSFAVATACAVILLMPRLADAYIGPGVGISAIGSFFALLGAILFAIVGFIWYPVKRLLRAMKRKRTADKAETSAA